MDTGIGATLREARNRRKIGLSEVEAAIKIRVRYLQAIENEDWDALPGGAYTRGFIRTYGAYLGLDGDRLADDYRRSTVQPGSERAPRRVEPVPTAIRGHRSPVSGAVVAVGVSLVLIALVVGIGLAGGDGDGDPSAPPAGTDGKKGGGAPQGSTTAAARSGVEVELAATAEVWVCLLGAGGRALVDGRILAAGEEAGPFRSNGYELALGNGSVRMLVDGESAAVEESSSPVGYRIDSGGELIALEEGERPDCE